jgi:hypothetical protein
MLIIDISNGRCFALVIIVFFLCCFTFSSFSLFSGRVNDSKIHLFRLSKSLQIMMAYTANNYKVIEVLSSSSLSIFYFSSLHFIYLSIFALFYFLSYYFIRSVISNNRILFLKSKTGIWHLFKGKNKNRRSVAVLYFAYYHDFGDISLIFSFLSFSISISRY